MNRFVFSALFSGSLLIGSQAFGITLGQSDNFNDGTLQGWVSGGINPNPPSNVNNVGQAGAGDHVMQVLFNDQGGGPGAQPVVFNSAQWTGDYLAAGITAITLDINNLSTIPINPGLEIRGAGGNINTVTGTTIPANSGWVSITLSLDPGNLVGPDVLGTLGAVTELRFREVQGGSFVIPNDATTAYYDNITAVPEPATLALMGLGACAMFRRRG